MISFQELATPICGLRQSSSPMPTARSMPRAAARSMPSVTSRLRGLMSGASVMRSSLLMCGGINGFTLGTTVNLCFVEGSRTGNSSEYTDWKSAKSTTLHELGHVWMSARGRGGPVPPEVTERFTKQAGLPTWADTEYQWRYRGVELAASTIAWALTDEPEVHPWFADRCSELGALFTTLTGKPVPESAQCPDYVAPSAAPS